MILSLGLGLPAGGAEGIPSLTAVVEILNRDGSTILNRDGSTIITTVVRTS